MATFSLNGKILRVNRVETVGEKGTKKQTVIIRKPGFVDEFGEKKGRDQDWEITLLGDSIEKFDLLNKNAQGKNAKCQLYLDSNTYEKDGVTRYIINARLASIELIGADAAPANTVPTGNPDDDDLPF